MSVLIIGPDEVSRVNQAINAARANPVPWERIAPFADATPPLPLRLADRKPGTDSIRAAHPSHNVMLGTYRVAISFEEQPAGLVRHLSVSSRNSRMVPGLAVMCVICDAFGIPSLPPDHGRVWTEEFEPGHFSVNVIQLEPPAA